MRIYSVHGASSLDYGGWMVLTRGIGRDPTDRNGENFRRFPHTKIVRLNHGYGTAGTIPLPQYYEDFSQRVANYVEMSLGCSRWIIGNEPNHRQERPEGQPITPAMYAQCFKLCRDKIKALQFHTGDQVLLAAIAPWNVDTEYPENESGDWLRYFSDVQAEIETGKCDGFAIHTYCREQTPESITSTARMDPPYELRFFGFQHYKNWMHAIAPRFQGLPVYCTEFCVAGEPWQDINTGCVQEAYAEIDRWNRLYPDQPIACLTMYRWEHDRWEFKDKPLVQEDFMMAVERGYSVPANPEPPGGEMDLLNPGLEPPFNQQGAAEITVARHWKADYNEVDNPSSKRPEWKPEVRDVGEGRVLEGQTSQKWFWTYGVGQGWISQVVQGLVPDQYYEFSAHVYVWSSAFDNPDESVQPGKMWCRLGVHPWGVDNANDLAVEYGGAVVDNYDKWLKLTTFFRARSDRAALFLWSSPEHPTKHNDVYWDKVSLVEWECDGGTEPPVEPPGPGECKLDWGKLAEVVEEAAAKATRLELDRTRLAPNE